MVFYLRQITLSIKTDDSVYAKRPLVKTSLLDTCREAPLGALTFRSLKKKSAFRARETRIFFGTTCWRLPPKAPRAKGCCKTFLEFSESCCFVYVKPLLLSRTDDFKNPWPAESSDEEFRPRLPGRPSASLGGRPARAATFFVQPLAVKSRFNSCLGNLNPAGELREKPQRRAPATSPSHGLRDPLEILSGRGRNSAKLLNTKKHQFYFAKRLVSKIGCRPRASVAKTFSQTYRFVYARR